MSCFHCGQSMAFYTKEYQRDKRGETQFNPADISLKVTPCVGIPASLHFNTMCSPSVKGNRRLFFGATLLFVLGLLQFQPPQLRGSIDINSGSRATLDQTRNVLTFMRQGCPEYYVWSFKAPIRITCEYLMFRWVCGGGHECPAVTTSHRNYCHKQQKGLTCLTEGRNSTVKVEVTAVACQPGPACTYWLPNIVGVSDLVHLASLFIFTYAQVQKLLTLTITHTDVIFNCIALLLHCTFEMYLLVCQLSAEWLLSAATNTPAASYLLQLQI